MSRAATKPRQLAECRLDDLAQFLCFRRCIGLTRDAVHVMSARSLSGVPPPLASLPISADVDHNPQKPRSKGRLFAERAQLLKRDEHRLLRYILSRVSVRPCEAPGEAIDVILVQCEQCFQRRLVSGFGGG